MVGHASQRRRGLRIGKASRSYDIENARCEALLRRCGLSEALVADEEPRRSLQGYPPDSRDNESHCVLVLLAPTSKQAELNVCRGW